ncbi:LSU ribosomal protein L6p (L9e) [Candidatus Nasuia deltocephalinicola]|uniref:50S ribosomal protein L6 n=1 Tax=Candidatus Nasuia deltocephalincola TaxID=1160784 RepID=A0A7G6UHK6_9PROT|nr:LSU ribosomal protein L6p (L9e) [Candidatus Nasuia deltocephalinicola]
MFFKNRYFKISRFSNKTIYLFNLFFNFNNFFLEFLGYSGYLKIFLNSFFIYRLNNFLKIFSLNVKNNNGFFYSIIYNTIKGLIFNYEKRIILFGLGFKLFLKSKYIYFYLSYSHPIICKKPQDLNIEILNLNELIVSGPNKQRVGEQCLKFRNYKKPDPYKGKGIRYFNEKIFLKSIKKK